MAHRLNEIAPYVMDNQSMDPFPQYQPPAELNGLHDFLFRLSEDLNDDSAPSTSYQNSYRTSQQSPDFDFGKTSYPGNIPVDSMPYSTAPVPGNLRHSSYAAPQPPPQSLIPTSLIDSIHDSKHRRSQSSTLRSSIDPTGGMQSQPNSQQSYNYDNRPSNQSGNDASYQPAPSVNDGIYYSPVDYNVRTIVTQMKAADSAGEGEKPTIGGVSDSTAGCEENRCTRSDASYRRKSSYHIPRLCPCDNIGSTYRYIIYRCAARDHHGRWCGHVQAGPYPGTACSFGETYAGTSSTEAGWQWSRSREQNLMGILCI